ncbi:glutathione-s-transferase [Plakobranchus ocellatus]|uniref:Glutathione-s-transferase n=1 Tax=Plakobranchus ocellatus TaxID=259542 RepID=A0AAV4BS05_9GAST|nr:glutathione-s-transferase [Plakobranchus ocellatus]
MSGGKLSPMSVPDTVPDDDDDDIDRTRRCFDLHQEENIFCIDYLFHLLFPFCLVLYPASPSLYGSTNLECLMIDQIVQLKEDILTVEIDTVLGSDQSKMAAAKKLVSEVYPRTMNIFNKFIQENPASSGFVIGEKMTLADLAIFEGSQSCYNSDPDFLKGYQNIMALREKVAAQDGVRQYLDKREKFTPIHMFLYSDL